MAISGDYRIDALLRGADYRWNAALPFGTQTVVSYAFSDTMPAYYQGIPDYVVTGGGSFSYLSLDEAHRAIVRSEFAILAAAIPGLSFFETSDVNAAVITLSAYTPGPDVFGDSDANGYVPNGGDAGGVLRASGDLWFRSTSAQKYDLSFTWNGIQIQPASFADMVLHELGHAMGLKHPGNYHNGSGSDAPPYLPAADDNALNTVMSYVGDFTDPHLRPYDFLAFDFLYGSTAPAGNLWLLANDGNTVVRGSGLNELILARPVSEDIDGGAGSDVVRYAGNRNAYSITKTAAGFSVADGAAGITDTLANIERLQFADKSLALDLTPAGSAGKTVEIIGAAFGPTALSNKTYVGIGIGLFDSGNSMDQVAALCIEKGLVSASDNSSFVTAVWSHVVGAPIDPDNLAYFKGLLDRGDYSQASLLVMAAETVVNQQHIDLVGLSGHGIEFL